MTKQKEQKHSVTIYLVKEAIDESNQKIIVDNDYITKFFEEKFSSWRKTNLKSFNFYYAKSEVSEPNWLKGFLNNEFDNKIIDLKSMIQEACKKYNNDENSSLAFANEIIKLLDGHIITNRLYNSISKAMLIVPVRKRFFILSFGYAAHSLDEKIIEPRFGLKLAIRMIDESKIQLLEGKELKMNPHNFLEQFLTGGSIRNFAINQDSDILKFICGKVDKSVITDNKLKITPLQISGRDCISFSSEININNVSKKLGGLLTIYNKKLKHDSQFNFVDNIYQEQDPTILIQLKNKLAEMIYNKTNNLNINLSFSRIYQTEEFESIICNRKAYDIFALDIDNVLEYIRNNSTSIDGLVSNMDKLKLTFKSSSSNNTKHQVTLYKSLITEINLNKQTYLLDNGIWYKVDDKYYNKINGYYNQLVKDGSSYKKITIDFDNQQDIDKIKNKVQISEAKFNERLSKLSSDFLLMDKKLANIHSGKLEVCDIYDQTDNAFIHIKRYKSSAELSHLFMQGVNSCGLFLHDRSFRDLLNQKFSTINWNDLYTNNEPKVVYGVIKKNGSGDIPFFSKISLYILKDRFSTFHVTPMIKFINIV